MKKLFYIILVIVMALGLVSCKNDSLANKAIEQGKLAMASKDYDKALSSFELAANEGVNDGDLKTIINIIKDYNNVKQYMKNNDIVNAKKCLDGINNDYSNYPIKDDINNLRVEIETLQKEAPKEVEVKEGSQIKVESTNEVKPKVNPVKEKSYYLKMLSNIEKNLSDLDYLYSDGVTANMKKAESEKYKKWDDALNEVYGVLKKQLSKTEMEKLKKEELEWIKYRDNSAEEVAAEFKGGTMEGLQYISTSAELTRERCYELVQNYMK